MKHKLLNKLWLRVGMIVAVMTTALVGTAWGEEVTGTIVFGTNATKIDKAVVTAEDSQGQTWTITTVGTTSFTSNSAYYQVGSSNKPATSITFTTTLDEDVSITAFSAKFGGFSGTQGTVTLAVDNTSVGTGNLNETTPVTVSLTSSITGRVLTVTVTNISKGVKVYNINYTYVTSSNSSPLSSIAVNTSAATTVFRMGDTFTHEGTVVTATYEDESTKDVTSNASFSTPDMNTAGTKEVTVSYTEGTVTKTATYNIEVKAPTSISLSGDYPTVFTQGATFSHEGLVVTANYDEGLSSKNVTDVAEFSTPDMTTTGTKTVTVTYGGLTTTYNITVNEYVQPTQFDIALNNTLFGTNYTGSASGISDDNPVVGTLNGVTVTYAGTGFHYINNNQIRFYPTNNLTFEAPTGYVITRIVFTADGTWAATISANSGEYTSNTKTWTGSETSVFFTGSGSSRCDMSKATITLELLSTKPSISADDVNVAYNATSGNIVYEIDNYVAGTMTAATEADWISNIVVNEADEMGEVTFDVTTNTAAENRTATVTLTYTYDTNKTVTANVTVTQLGAPTITVNPATVNATAAETEGTIAVTYNSIDNSAGIEIHWFESDGTTTASEPDWIAADFNTEGNVDYIISPNTGTARTAYFKVYGLDADANDVYSDLVTVTQAAPAITVIDLRGTTTAVSFNAGDFTASGTGYKSYTNVTYTGSNNVDYSGWTLNNVMHSGNDMQMKASVGEVIMPAILTDYGFTISVVKTGDNDVSVNNGEETGTNTLTTTDTNAEITIVADDGFAVISTITITPTPAPQQYALTVSNLSHVDLFIFGGDESETIINTENGESTAQVYNGTNVEVSVDVETGYELQSLVVDGTDVTNQIDSQTGMYVFTMPNHDVTITATAVEETVTPTRSGYFVKVTSASDLISGDYLIVYETETGGVAFNGSLETLDAVNNTIDVTINNNKITPTSENLAAIFTIDVANGTLRSASGKYIGVSSNSNGLKQTDNANTYTNSFSFDANGNAVISAVFSASSMSLRYNSASNQARFRYYSSGQQAIQLYRYVDLKLNAYGYATYASTSGLDFSSAEAAGYSAWAITGVSGETITFSQITGAVAAGTGVLLKGGQNAYITLTPAESGATLTDMSSNLLVGITAPTRINSDEYFGLSGDKFVRVNGGTVPAGKALLPTSALTVKALTFSFDDATGIETIENGQLTIDDEIYNLAGQRLNKMQKGINIVNGKKILK